MKKPGISVFFPCYNDENSIGNLVEAAYKTLESITREYEVIVVDDGSTDESREVLKELKKRYKNLKLVFHKKNAGYGKALQSGLKKASCETVFYTDGDGQYDVGELPLLFNLMTPDTDFVNGIKMARNDPTYRILLGNMYSFLVRWLFWLPVYDVDCDFRLIRKAVLDKIKLQSVSGSICVELVKKAQLAGARFRQVTIHHYERKWGESQFFRLDRLLNTFVELTELWIGLMLRKNLG